jgi:hypothetical protein
MPSSGVKLFSFIIENLYAKGERDAKIMVFGEIGITKP